MAVGGAHVSGIAGVLSHVAVAPEARGCGVGSQLTDAFVAAAAARGATRVRTMTRAGDDGAGGLYSSLGWRSIATRPDVDGRPFDHFEITP